MSANPLNDNWQDYVRTDEFEQHCITVHSRRSSSSGSSDSSARRKIFEEDDASSESVHVHDVPKLEKYYYYFDIRSDGCLGPPLVYRTSKDQFTPPSGPENDPRPMRLLQVDDHAKLGKDNLWPAVRDKVGILLHERQISFTSIDLVRFGWDGPIVNGAVTKVLSAVTIWVGVQKNSTTGDMAYESSQDILSLFKEHDIDDVDVAFRESETRFLAGPRLLAPVDDESNLKNVIHSLTTALGLPIAGEKTPESEGTMGFYFRQGNELYGVTARHVLFDLDRANKEFNYPPSPKTNVILMGSRAFVDLVESIEAEIGSLTNYVSHQKRLIDLYTGKPQMAAKLAAAKAEVETANAKIHALKDFFVMVQRDWSDPEKRVIGHVVWAPPITGNTPPYGYTKDVCVIKLDKVKFWDNFAGNVIDLAYKIDVGDFMSMMHGRVDKDNELDFEYPLDRHLFKLQGILTAEEIKKPTTNIPVRFVIKNGYKTATTIGRMSRFESKTRLYGITGTFESLEATVLPYGKNPYFTAFSRGGDSGSIVGDPKRKFVSLLTGGTGPSTDSVDITYTTPMHWLWDELILYFDEN